MSRLPLSKEQRAAILSDSPLTFVESVPGSGKTTIAAERFGLLHHASNNRSDPRGIVAVSFARSAVSELRTRVAARWGTRTLQPLNRITTMDGLHRAIVDFLLQTNLVIWPGEFTKPQLIIDSWAWQRGATRVGPREHQSGRCEFGLKDRDLMETCRTVDSSCWGIPYEHREDWIQSIENGVCTHDEIRQVVKLALDRDELQAEIDAYLCRTYHHVIIDEAFDLNDLDTLLVVRCIESGLRVTLVGDPWQSLYEWRDAQPKTVHSVVANYNFDQYPILQSFRFQSEETVELARALREREPVTIPRAQAPPDVVLAAEWKHLLDVGDDIIPLSFGQLACQTDAAIALMLDVVTRARLRTPALGQPEAMRCLGLDVVSLNLAEPKAALSDDTVSLENVLEQLRVATKVNRQQKPSLPAALVDSRIARLGLLRGWIRSEGPHVPGLTFHQAKGKEWRAVDIALDKPSRDALAQGLDHEDGHHRKIYVGCTRGIETTRLRPLSPNAP